MAQNANRIQIFITFVSGTGLASKDANGKSDPFIKSWLQAPNGKVLEASRKATKVQRKTLNPEWSEKASMRANSQLDALHIEVWDWDRVGSDDFMGQVVVSVKELMQRFNDSRTMNLSLLERPDCKKKEGVKGFVTIRINGIQQTGKGSGQSRAMLYNSSAAVSSGLGDLRNRLGMGENLGIADTTSGLTPLQQAAYVGDYDTVKLLVEEGAVDASTCTGLLRWPAALYACMVDQGRTLTVLAPLLPVDSLWGQPGVERSAVHVSAEYASVHCLRYLLKLEGAQVDALCEAWDAENPQRGTAALHLACRGYMGGEQRLETVRALLDAGAQVDLLDASGRTALFFAVESGAEEIVAALLEAGASKDVVDIDGKGIQDVLAVLKRTNRQLSALIGMTLKK